MGSTQGEEGDSPVRAESPHERLTEMSFALLPTVIGFIVAVSHDQAGFILLGVFASLVVVAARFKRNVPR